MKKSGGIIVRLIDIVLNLLFGFLMVTDIIYKNEIKLPNLAGTKSNMTTTKKVLPLEIQILPGDTIIAEINPQTESSLKALSQLYCYYLIQETDHIYRIRRLDKLEEYLSITKASYDSITVVVDPDPGSIIQGTINLVDLCRKYGIEKKFRFVEREE